MRPKTAVPTLIVCLTILVGFHSWSLAATGKAQIANLKFSGPVSQADQEYLGLKTSGNFSLQDIQAPYVLIEIMRSTCPFCIKQAPIMNRLYKLVVNSDLKDKVKFIGVGESDTVSTLPSFKAAYKVPFPLVPDPEWDIGVDVFHIQGTPTTVVVDKRGTILLREDGLFNRADRVFRELKARLR